MGDAGKQVFFKLIPNKNAREDYRQGAALISKLFASKGITSACDADASHCTLLTDALIQRMRALQVIPAPFSGYVYFHGDVLHFYGQERTQHMFPMRSFLDAGLRPTDSSDYTASPAAPMMWLQSQLTRTDMKGNVWGANQRITLQEGIRCGTINGAYAAFEEELKGSIQPGRLADLVVLAQDPFKTDPSELLKIQVERTMVGGSWKYES